MKRKIARNWAKRIKGSLPKWARHKSYKAAKKRGHYSKYYN